MEGYVKIKVNKFARAFITRVISIIPSLAMAFTSDPDYWNSKLNILQAI